MRILAIPVKPLGASKSRLAPTLEPLERGALTLAMLEDVLDAALQITGWQPWVVSPDEVVLEVAVRRGAVPMPEHTSTLLDAIRHVDQEAFDRGAEALAVMLADTPMLTAPALSAAVHTLGPVVLAPSADGKGTNLLLRRPPTVIRPRFGSDSFARHGAEAAAKGLPVAEVRLPELAFDLDAPNDILTLLRSGRGGRTRDVCVELGLESRLRVRT